LNWAIRLGFESGAVKRNATDPNRNQPAPASPVSHVGLSLPLSIVICFCQTLGQ
jgi:hypothetical protein